uniref:Retrovirus-related Pol polyprotein from transposon TNT 1-94 n=1 Tax=Cajanus cajan TaxID=3821 RepID=A0A151TYD4_CAJCA|nr:hypothetical protein KK1_011341 [Cajanus cajan]
MVDFRPSDTPMDPHVKLLLGQGEPLDDPERYRKLVGRLNYLIVIRPNIAFPVSVVSQFIYDPRDSHWTEIMRILKYVKKASGCELLYEDKDNSKIVYYSDVD